MSALSRESSRALTELRRVRDAAAKRGDSLEAENINARVKALKEALAAEKEAAFDAMLAALRPFEEIAGEGSEDFPDDAAAVIQVGRSTHYALTLGDFRRICAAIALAERQP